MIRKILFIVIVLLYTCGVDAQQYGNEWINYDQKYLKFNIIEDGVYKINYTTLRSALSEIDLSIDSIDHRNIQIFANGVEQYIHIESSSASVFNSSSKIEFYAEKNDGWLDTLLYDSTSSQCNPHISLYNDTVSYFLTLNDRIDNRRVVDTVNTSFPATASSYFIKEEVQYSTDFGPGNHWKGVYDSNNKHASEYTEGEGWFFPQIENGPGQTYSFNTSNAYTGASAPDALLESVVAGINNPAGIPDHHIQLFHSAQAGAPFFDQTFESFNQYLATSNIQATQMPASIDVLFKHGSNSHASSKSALSYIKLRYPHIFDLNGASEFMMIIPSSTFDTYVNISNFSTSFPSTIYDIDGHYRITTTQTSGNTKAIIPSGNEKRCFIFTSDMIKSVPKMVPAGVDGVFTDYLSQNPDSAFLIITHPRLMVEANKYATYRETNNGGNFSTLVADIIQLYDQFGYGISKHPISIVHFADYLLDNLSTPPSNLFLIGKSITYSNSRFGPAFEQNLVPTIGYPSSDNMFTAGLNGTTYEPAIPTGRLSAIVPSDVSTYLDKVKALEIQHSSNSASIDTKDWMKHVIHFGGGNGVTQQTQFEGILNRYKDTISATLFGAEVHSIFKNSSAVISVNQSDTIKTWIENGVSLITFFGHSSAQGFDISLDDPQFYDNENKYPMFIANGCQSGNIHNFVTNDSKSASESFVLTEKAGAIGFLASADLGIASHLDTYSMMLYRHISKISYGESIGNLIKRTIDSLHYGNSQLAYLNGLKLTFHEMTLHGDPSIRINPHKKPDYAIERSSLSFNPDEVSTDLDTFDLVLNITNLGVATEDSVPIQITRRFPDGSSVTYSEILPPIYYQYTHTLSLPAINGSGIGSGENVFSINIDPLNFIDELHTSNNFLLNVPLWISSNELIPIFPYDYAVVPTKDITLKASTADAFASSRSYIIQVDTKDTYDSNGGSPLDETIITQTGGVISWTPNLGSFTDSAVFYWRCSPADTLKWRERSFQFIKGKSGWGQDDFFQFKNDEFKGIKHIRSSEKFEFTPYFVSLFCRTVKNSISQNTSFTANGQLIEDGVCHGKPGMYVAVFDALDLEPWKTEVINGNDTANPGNNFGDLFTNGGCFTGSGPRGYFNFIQGVPGQLDSLEDMLTNDIPDSNYILVYTANRGDFDSSWWQSSHFQAFVDMGATDILNLSNDDPYIFFTKKGDNSTTVEVTSSTANTITLNENMTADVPSGTITSTIIGPAYEWKSLHWKHTPDDAVKDSVTIDIYGIDLNGVQTLIETLDDTQTDILQLDTIVDANLYPFLRLVANIEDTLLQSSGQLERWHVLFEGIPEAALNQANAFFFPSDTILEGQGLTFSVAIENISIYDMDSLRVAYWVEDSYGNKTNVAYDKQAPLLAGNILQDTIEYNSIGSANGRNVFWIEVNPKDSLWQLEQYHFNNIARMAFHTDRDNINPLLDVTFDGIHILDGDIVSPVPEIIIELDDENQFLPLRDTADFTVYITDPEGNQTLVHFINSDGSENMIFTPAELPENRARVTYNPTFEVDGVYTLTVQGKDESGNLAGDHKYSVSFEVINESSITQILNYPNPFSTATKFVFVLTGSQVPDEFKIQILTVSGKVVREITKEELGDIRIGRNISPYTWNGTDEFGDPLANGVYLYRVITKINGEEIKNRDTEADVYFKRGFGKMYLMR